MFGDGKITYCGAKAKEKDIKKHKRHVVSRLVSLLKHKSAFSANSREKAFRWLG